METLKEKYFSEHNYIGFIDYLKDLKKKSPKQDAQASYYIALSRYNQLKYLEESQNWDEYFNRGNDYRDELVKEASNTINLTTTQDSLNLYGRLLLWQFHKDQQDVFVEKALEDLMNAVGEYSSKKDDSQPIKYIADKLYSYGNKSESKKLYGIYVDKLLKTETKPEDLKKAAQDAYEQRNISLAATIYDVYIERITKSYPKEKTLPLLIAIAKDSIYKDEGSSDPEYAEKIFKKIEEIGGNEVLDEETSYLRAYNLEKSKVYPEAKDKYITLMDRFPKTPYFDEAVFKCGIINTYVLKDIDKGIGFFEKLASKTESHSPYVISSIYQLGLLSQWNKDLTKAKEYYTQLLGLLAEGFMDTKELCEERLKELEKNGEIEYNLKMFLDASLKENFDMTKIDLRAHPYKISREKDTRISSNITLPESGCMSVEVNYLWSGHLGKVKASIDQSEFTTSYLNSGTKEINLVVITPSGILDRSIDMIDIE